MTHPEHTPQDTRSMREAAADPLSPHDTHDLAESAPGNQQPVQNTAPQQHGVHAREIHHYTVPNRKDGHYPDSPLFRDIINNPALYMDRADF